MHKRNGSNMEQEIFMPTLAFFRNGNDWTGSLGLLRFYLRPQEEALTVETWCGPFCREYSETDETETFPLGEDGLAALLIWLKERAAVMNEHPTKTAEECQKIYEQKSKAKE